MLAVGSSAFYFFLDIALTFNVHLKWIHFVVGPVQKHGSSLYPMAYCIYSICTHCPIILWFQATSSINLEGVLWFAVKLSCQRVNSQLAQTKSPSSVFFLIHLFLLFPSHSLVLNMELFSQAADLCNLIWPQLLISREKGVCIWLCSLSLYKADTVWAAVSKYNLCCSMIPLCLNQ